MLIYNSRLLNMPVLSVQDSGKIGTISNTIVDPDTLKIIALRVHGAIGSDGGNILDVNSVREYSEFGLVIDSTEELVKDDDIVKIAKVLELNFSLIGLKVETKKGSKLGKVLDFTVTDDNFSVAQIVVKRPTVKSFFDSELIIPRAEIVEITDYKIIVRDEEKVIKERALKEDFVPNFVNPFRKSEQQAPAPNHIETPAEQDKQ
ncbi:PRC-barrel domain-containing protein [Candidatus Saccharibacteria bacterium]|nr:PRC-barrel domain-containing protein [Candidatus Saccharibacteria bacterium]MBQ6149613.1 PRC-barrel domain-containing protein [Candidatus Saccharibacteria bacterium]